MGLAVAAFGAFVWLGSGAWLSWFGRLPGDIRIERPGFRLYAPLVSMLLVSLLLSAILWLWRRLSEHALLLFQRNSIANAHIHLVVPIEVGSAIGVEHKA